jgi:hypothetical protein
VWVLVVFGLGRFTYRGFYDMTHPPLVIVGPVVQVESDVNSDAETPDHFYIAVDAGDGGPAHWWEISRSIHDRVRLYQWVRLTATPKLGHVRTAEIQTQLDVTL